MNLFIWRFNEFNMNIIWDLRVGHNCLDNFWKIFDDVGVIKLKVSLYLLLDFRWIWWFRGFLTWKIVEVWDCFQFFFVWGLLFVLRVRSFSIFTTLNNAFHFIFVTNKAVWVWECIWSNCITLYSLRKMVQRYDVNHSR